jgi:hypothetical protein
MITVDEHGASKPLTLREFGYRAVGTAFIACGLLLAGLGLASGSAHAAPTSPAPQGYLCSDAYGMMTWCDD